MTIGELSKKLSEGLTINEIVNSDLNLIGNKDDVESVEDVTVPGTTDNFVSSVRQKGSRDRTNAIYAIDVANNILEEENPLVQDNLSTRFPVVSRNLDVLIDSLKRTNNADVYQMVITELFNNINTTQINPTFRQFLIGKLR